jgi:hypothetical protein
MYHFLFPYCMQESYNKEIGNDKRISNGYILNIYSQAQPQLQVKLSLKAELALFSVNNFFVSRHFNIFKD